MENTVNLIMQKLESLGNEQIKKIYIKHGAKEPLFGIKTMDLRPIVREIKKNYDLSIKLYDTPLFCITNGISGVDNRLLIKYDFPT